VKTRAKKIVLILLGVALAVVVALAVLVKVLVTPERVRQTVVPLVEKNLHRSLQLGAIDVGLFSGIRLNDVVLLEADGKSEFVGVDGVVLRYRLLPLLLLKVDIDEIRIDHPRLHIDRAVDGRFNFSDLAGATPPPEAGKPAAGSGAGAAPLDLHIASFILSDGELRYRDASVKPVAEHRVTALNVTVNNFSLRERFPLKLTADWNGNALGVDGDFDLDDLAARIQLTFNRLQLLCEGDVLHEAKGERLRAKLQVPRIAVKDLVASLPRDLVQVPAELAPDGALKMTAQLDGLLSEPSGLLRQAQLDLDAVSVRSGGIQPQLTGAVLLDGRKLAIDKLKIAVGGETLQLSASSADLFAAPPALALNLTGKRFDLDRAMPSAKGDSTAPPPAAQAGEEIGPLSVPLQLQAEVMLDEMVARGMTLRPLQLKLALRDDTLRLESLTAGIDEGRLTSTARVDLRQKGLKYAGTLQLAALPVNPLVKAFKPALGESLYGIVDGRIDYSGRGTLPATAKQQLSATGELQLRDGLLKSLPVLDATAKLLGVASLREVTLEKGQIAFVIKDGLVQLDSAAGGSKVRLTSKGTVGLDGRLDLAAGVGLGPELSQQLDRSDALSRTLSDKEGWTTVPLLIGGSADKPKVSLDSKALAKQATGKALDRLSESLQKKLAPPADDKQPASDKKGVDTVLKELLKR